MENKQLRGATPASARALASVVHAEGKRLMRLSRAGAVAPALRKAKDDFATAADVAAETRLRRALARLDPDAGFFGEESARATAPSARTWVVDPIDGTSNFAAGVGIFGVAAALLHGTEPVIAACFDGRTHDTAYAARGRGARLLAAGLPLRCRPSAATVWGPLALIGVQWNRNVRVPLPQRLRRVPGKTRVLGCTVSQLLAAASGAFGCALQDRGKIWDLAAPGLIAAEAGAAVLTLDGRPLLPFPDDALAHPERDYTAAVGTPALVERVVRMLQKQK